MRLVFMGTPQFSVQPLHALVDAGHEIAGVVTRIDKPSGRGQAVTAPAVKLAAQQMKLPLHQPKRVREPEFIKVLETIHPEIIVVVAYGQILPKEILLLPQYGCINIHASLLPLYRGAAPINWAIINGETQTGITIMKMDEGMDTGGILLQEAIPIDPGDTAGTLADRLSGFGARLITAALPSIRSGELQPTAQDHSRATPAPLLKKEDGLIDWNRPVQQIHNRVRGLSPWPGAFTFLGGKMIKILETAVMPGTAEPGTIHQNDTGTLDIGSGSGILRIMRLQPEGKKPMTASEFLRGHRGIEGKKFAKS